MPVLLVTGQTWLYVRVELQDTIYIFFKIGIAFLTPAFCFQAFFGTCFEALNSRPQSGNAVRVNGFGVQSLETLHFLTSLVFRGWKRCTCQRIWCSVSRNVAPVSRFGVQNLETSCLSADLVFRIWKRCACQWIWCSKFGTWRRFLKNLAFPELETLCLSTDFVFSVSKRCACQRIWFSESGNVVPVSGFGVQNLETLCLSIDLAFKIWKRGVS